MNFADVHPWMQKNQIDGIKMRYKPDGLLFTINRDNKFADVFVTQGLLVDVEDASFVLDLLIREIIKLEAQ